MGREEDGYLSINDIENFPCADLRKIDQLWVKYSKGKFGFSVQKKIYQSLGGTKEYDRKVWVTFCDKVGWRKVGKWLEYKDLFMYLEHYEGHLPRSVNIRTFVGTKINVVRKHLPSLLSRRDL
jgi:hypothetical protein